MGGGRDDSMGMRQLEAITVREIINRKFDNPADALWCVVGDLNDYQQVIKVRKELDANGNQVEDVVVENESGVDPLLTEGFGVNLAQNLAAADRWTHYYASGRHKTQLDYIIASPALAAKMVGQPGNCPHGHAPPRAKFGRHPPLPPHRLGSPKSIRPLPAGGGV